ncbi:MAG: flavodoxin family protein [Lentihominibacter sp.]
MKTLIVYYSLEGNTDYAAGMIGKITGGDLLRLEPKKAYPSKGFSKFIWGGKSAMMGEKPELKPYDVDLESYDLIVLGFPVWASTVTPPIRTFVEENREALRAKAIAAFACQSGNGGEKALNKLEKLIGISELAAEAIFIDPKLQHNEATDRDIEDFAGRIAEGNYR